MLSRTLLLAAILPIASCDDVVFNGRAPSYASCLRDPPLTWENTGMGLMDLHCNGCHHSLLRGPIRNGAPVGVDFDTYPMVLEWAERIQQRAVVERSMPPGGGPDPEGQAKLQEWMLCEVLPDASEYDPGE